MTGNVTSADTNYNALTGADVVDLTITTADDDVPGVILTAVDDTTGEDGSTGTVSVVLTAQPSSNVSVTIISSDTSEGTDNVNDGPGKGLIFTPSNWNVPQIVTVTDQDDSLVDGDVQYLVRVGGMDGDAAFELVDVGTIAPVTMTNIDDETVPAPMLEAASDSGVSNTDLITNAATPTVTRAAGLYHLVTRSISMMVARSSDRVPSRRTGPTPSR